MNDDLDEFYDEVGRDYEWVCPGIEVCPKLKEGPTIGIIMDNKVIPSVPLGFAKKCRICKKKQVIPASASAISIFSAVNEFLKRDD